jgi:Lysine methyltransferase
LIVESPLYNRTKELKAVKLAPRFLSNLKSLHYNGSKVKMADSGCDDVDFELESIEIASHSFEITTIAHLPIEMLMFNQSRGVEISGQKVWCGSLTVADYILRNKDLIKNRVVIELGAGTGILGMVCSRIGCRKTILTDNDPRSIKHMVEDCHRNSVEADVRILDWFCPDVSSLEISGENISSNLCVIAGDVLYKRTLLKPFFCTSRLLLESKSESTMYLCHVPRAGVEYADVVGEATGHGLLIEEINFSSEDTENARKYCPEEDTSRAKLFKICLSG